MKIVLADDVVGLGDIGSTVTVKPGYARNYLIPRGLAFEADASNARAIAHRMKQVEAKKRRLKVAAEKLSQSVRELELTFEVRVGSGGKIFGSIGARDIAEVLVKKGFAVDRRRVMISEPLKKLGTHFVTVKLHPEVQAQLKLILKGSQATQVEEALETEEARERIEAGTEESDEDEA